MSKKIDVSTPKYPNTYTLVDDEDYDKIMAMGKWNTNERGYIRKVIKINGKRKYISLHRFIMNAINKQQIDHINHITYDNRKCNLRICNSQQNNMNRIKIRKKTSSNYKGVKYFKRDKKWNAVIRYNYKFIYLGSFYTEIEAAYAYNQAAIKYYKEFAYLNDIDMEKLKKAQLSAEIKGGYKTRKKTSKYKYIHKCNTSNKWITKIKYNKKDMYIGSFRTEIEAAHAYNKKVIELFGNKANLIKI
jgi:hypothetical protein